MLEIAHAVLAECGGPLPEKSAEFFYGLEKNGVIVISPRHRIDKIGQQAIGGGAGSEVFLDER